MTTPTPRSPTHRFERSELALVAALFLTGVVLRCAHPARMAVEHFDEGVYASDIWFGLESGNHYPAQHLFAPPLLPEAIFWTFVFGGASNVGAMLPSLVAGCLTILLVWWAARSWFSPAAGLAAATLCALSDPHIAFCRTALTDVPLCFWLLAAVHCLWLASTRGSYLWAVVAGIVTGLAWWTKYNGWLPLAIGAAGFAAMYVVSVWRARATGAVAGSATPASKPQSARRPASQKAARFRFASSPPPNLLLLLTAAIVACAVWSPWLLSLQDQGGYAAVAANHRGYLVGWQGWLGSAVEQFRNLQVLEGQATLGAVAMMIVVLAIRRACQTRRFTWNDGFNVLVLVGAFGSMGMPPLFAVFALFGLTGSILLASLVEEGNTASRVKTASWLLAAWCGGLTLTTPLYTPYPRLALPWLMSVWLGTTAAIYSLEALYRLERRRRPDVPTFLELLNPLPRVAKFIMVAIVGAALVVTKGLSTREIVPAWSHRDGLVHVATQIAADLSNPTKSSSSNHSPDTVIYTYGEPALLFQLRLAGIENVFPVASLPGAEPRPAATPVTEFVAVGEHARRTAGFAEQFEAARDRLELVASYEYAPCNIVLLDNRAPRDRPPANSRDARPTYSIDLYRVR